MQGQHTRARREHMCKDNRPNTACCELESNIPVDKLEASGEAGAAVATGAAVAIGAACVA